MAAAGQAFARERYVMSRYVRDFEGLYGEMLSAVARDRVVAQDASTSSRRRWNAVPRLT
jgi:hypothetical protein